MPLQKASKSASFDPLYECKRALMVVFQNADRFSSSGVLFFLEIGVKQD